MLDPEGIINATESTLPSDLPDTNVNDSSDGMQDTDECDGNFWCKA